VDAYIATFSKDIDEWFDTLAKTIGGDVAQQLKTYLSPLTDDNEFWMTVQGEAGNGYRKRVIALYQDELEPKMTRYVKKQVEKRWKQVFIERILAIFGDEDR
jgi:hypothetical protein